MIKDVCSLQDRATACLFEILRSCSLKYLSANQADSAVTAPPPACCFAGLANEQPSSHASLRRAA